MQFISVNLRMQYDFTSTIKTDLGSLFCGLSAEISSAFGERTHLIVI